MGHSRVRFVVGALLLAGALVMVSTLSAQAASSPSLKASSAETHQIDVSATGAWQGHIWVAAGTWVTIQAPSVGHYWTVDYRPDADLPYVGAQGYRGEPVWGGNTTCKADPGYPYGALLFRRLGENPTTGTAAGSTGFGWRSDGYLEFSINDRGQCQGDNAGSLPVTVSLG
jgi:hypothetical protein